MAVENNGKTRCSRSAPLVKLSRYCLLMACVRSIQYSCIQAFQSDATIFSHHKVFNRAIVYKNYPTTSTRNAKNQLDDDDELDDEETPTNSQRRLARVRNRVKDLARKMVQVPIHVASSITPMPQAVAAVLKDATLNAVDLAVEEGKFCAA